MVLPRGLQKGLQEDPASQGLLPSASQVCLSPLFLELGLLSPGQESHMKGVLEKASQRVKGSDGEVWSQRVLDQERPSETRFVDGESGLHIALAPRCLARVCL